MERCRRLRPVLRPSVRALGVPVDRLGFSVRLNVSRVDGIRSFRESELSNLGWNRLRDWEASDPPLIQQSRWILRPILRSFLPSPSTGRWKVLSCVGVLCFDQCSVFIYFATAFFSGMKCCRYWVDWPLIGRAAVHTRITLPCSTRAPRTVLVAPHMYVRGCRSPD